MKIKEIKVFKSKGLVFAQFWYKFKNSTSGWSKTARALFQIYFYTELVKYLYTFLQKTWRAGRISLKFGVVSNQVVLRKTLENENFIRPALLCANIYQIFFSHLDTRKYLLLFFQESVQLVPSLYHILQQGCQNSNWFLYCWDGVSTRTQIFERKWNWQNMFTQIFLSEIISIAENGGQGTHFLISQILKGLTHSAVRRGEEELSILGK